MFTEAFDEFTAWQEVNGTFEEPFGGDREERRQLQRKWALQESLRNALTGAWATYYGLKRAGVSHWQSLFNKRYPAPNSAMRRWWQTPEGDHCSVWRRISSKGFESTEVFVSQPYPLSDRLFQEMKDFADEHGLCFWIGERPAWHFPGRVLHVEWARPSSTFARLRDTAEADRLHRTTYRHSVIAPTA